MSINTVSNSKLTEIIQSNLNDLSNNSEKKISMMIPLIQQFLKKVTQSSYLEFVKKLCTECNLSETTVKKILSEVLKEMGSLRELILCFFFLVGQEEYDERYDNDNSDDENNVEKDDNLAKGKNKQVKKKKGGSADMDDLLTGLVGVKEEEPLIIKKKSRYLAKSKSGERFMCILI
jgi:hypothetical protein